MHGFLTRARSPLTSCVIFDSLYGGADTSLNLSDGSSCVLTSGIIWGSKRPRRGSFTKINVKNPQIIP